MRPKTIYMLLWLLQVLVVFLFVKPCSCEKKPSLRPVTEDRHRIILAIIKGDYDGLEKRCPTNVQSAFRYIRRLKKNFVLEISSEKNPITGQIEERILVGGKLLLKKTEISMMTEKTFKESKGSGATKLTHRLEHKYEGVCYKNILTALKNIPDSQASRPVFDNKAPLKPIRATFVQQRHQIDLVSFNNLQIVNNGNTYRYVLSVIDVFSRYIWLRALESKTSETVSHHLEKIYSSEGPPLIIQCDNGNEFRGAVSILCKRLGVKIICSSPYHPQSQGKIESSHTSWKRKLYYDLRKQTATTWVDSLDIYCMLRNEEIHHSTKFTPFEIYHGRQSNRLKPQFKDHTNTTSNLSILQYLDNMSNLRKKARDNSDKAAKYMIRRNLSKDPPSRYNVDETVLVKTASGKKRGKITKKSVSSGKIVQRNSKTHMYKVQMKPNVEKWFRICDLAALTRQRELELRKNKNLERVKMLCNCVNDTCSNSPDSNCCYGLSKLCCRKKNHEMRCNIPNHNKLDLNNFIKKPIDKQCKQNVLLQNILEMQRGLVINKQSASDELIRNALQYNLVPSATDIPKDGNCLFHSLAQGLFALDGTFRDQQEIRDKVVDYLTLNPYLPNGEHLQDFVLNRDWHEYLDGISDNEWGDHICILAAANAFNIRVVVASSQNYV